MEDGSIYRLNFDNNAPTLSKIDELSKYKVDDIISWSTSFPAGYAYKIVFSDGTILKKNNKIIKMQYYFCFYICNVLITI